MQQREIDAGGFPLLSVVPQPARRRSNFTAAEPVIVGFDTEYRRGGRSLLSVQFATYDAAGTIVSKVIYPPSPRLTPSSLAELVVAFLTEVDRLPALVRRQRKIVLVSHYAAAELGTFEDALRDVRIRQIGKAHHATLPVLLDAMDHEWHVRVVDLFAYYNQSLEQVGAMVGLPKLVEDPTTLEALLHEDRDRFEAYAKRDVEIAVLAFERLRSSMREQWGVDVLQAPSLPSLASTIFRRNFLTVAPAPTTERHGAVSVKRKAGWTTRVKTFRLYSGPPEIRLAAMRSYWGGRTEALVRGFVQGPVVELDVRSLYPSAALLQPLPNENTRWQRVTTVDEVRELEGFGNFEFSFPTDFKFPSLPVVREGAARLAFTTKGETFCTFSEIRAALALGAVVKVLDGWGFTPGASERDHELGRYLQHFMEEKSAAPKGSLEYETAKLLMNGLIGKLAEHGIPSKLLDLERHARQAGASGFTNAVARDGKLRDTLKGRPRVGALWTPEWASLILGRSRALMADLVAKGAMLVSTDAVLVPPDLSVEGPALEALRSVGSDLEQKVEGDAMFVARSRLYAILQRAGHVRPGATVYAQDEHWAVVRVARHGTAESKEEFAQTVLACIAAGKDVAVPRTRTRLVGAEAAVREELHVNEEVRKTGTTTFQWDAKRRLLDRDTNPFTSYTRTAPYLSLAMLEAAEHHRELRAGTARVRRRHAGELQDVVLHRLRMGDSIREIAKTTGVPKSTVGDMKKRVAADGDTELNDK
jgi:hypothetical protein